jgi:hypothetical protein
MLFPARAIIPFTNFTLCQPADTLLSASAGSEEADWAEARRLANEISQVFAGQIAVEWENPTSRDNKISMTPVTNAGALREYLTLFHREISIYPPCLFSVENSVPLEPRSRRNRRKREAIANRKLSRFLMTEGNTYDMSSGTVGRTAIPDAGLPGQLIYDVTAVPHQRYREQVIHHELYHYIDWSLDNEWDRADSTWETHNPESCCDGHGGAAAQTSNARDASSIDGFISNYAEASLDEDKAELFAHVVQNTAHVRTMYARSARIRGKVAWLKNEFLSFCPAMDAAWWESRFPTPTTVHAAGAIVADIANE